MFMVSHEGPSGIRPDNKARKPRRGSRGAHEKQAKKKVEPRSHEARASRPARKRGFGKIKSTGKPRFTRHTKF